MLKSMTAPVHSRMLARRAAFSLLELLACVSILAILVMVIVPRLGTGASLAKRKSCDVNRQIIEVQAAMWHRTKGNWPSTTLSDIGADPSYFPEGLPICPVDGSSYQLDGSRGTVITHTH